MRNTATIRKTQTVGTKRFIAAKPVKSLSQLLYKPVSKLKSHVFQITSISISEHPMSASIHLGYISQPLNYNHQRFPKFVRSVKKIKPVLILTLNLIKIDPDSRSIALTFKAEQNFSRVKRFTSGSTLNEKTQLLVDEFVTEIVKSIEAPTSIRSIGGHAQ